MRIVTRLYTPLVALLLALGSSGAVASVEYSEAKVDPQWEIFSAVDINNNNALDRDEAARAELTGFQYRQVDFNNNGLISPQEYDYNVRTQIRPVES